MLKGFGQTTVMGSTIKYVLFNSSGAEGDKGVSNRTRNIGTQIGGITAFENVDGV